jgi:gas vesicle protein
MEEMNRSQNPLIWCLVGAAAGAATALLLAPRPGKQTRAKLAKGWRDTLDTAGDLTNELTEKARSVANKAASLAQRAARVAETASDAALETADSFERQAERVSRR